MTVTGGLIAESLKIGAALETVPLTVTKIKARMRATFDEKLGWYCESQLDWPE